MPSRPGNDDRMMAAGGDRGGHRDESSDNGEQGRSHNGSARTRSNRGFASMDRDKQREIASKGGRAAHAKGTAHEFDTGEAREAGRKGGMAVSRNREHMAAIGRRGGEARGQSRSRSSTESENATHDNASENAYESSRDSSRDSSRNASTGSDRQVAINNESDGVNSNSQGNRGGNSSFGGERHGNATNSDATSRNETFGNH
jgi:general stress protein YciG